MNINEYLKIASHLDSIGALSISDELDQNFSKIAQVQREDPRGGRSQALYNTLDLFGRQFERGTLGYRPLEYIPNSHGEINAYADWAMKEKNRTSNPKLKIILQMFYDKMVDAKNSLISIAQQNRSPFKYKPSMFEEFGSGQSRRQKQLQINSDVAAFLKNSDYDSIQQNFYNWRKKQKDIFNESVYNSYKGKIDSASILISSINNQKLMDDISSGKVKPVPKGARPSSGSGASGRPGGGSGGGSGGYDSSTRINKPPVKPFDTNNALYQIVYNVVKNYDKDTSFADMNVVYDKIKQEPMLKEAILDKIKSSKYTSENKEKLIKKFLEKIGDTEPGPTPPEPTPPGPTPPSPTPSDQDVRPSPFLHDEVRKLSELDDREFMKVFESKSTILSRQIMSSYTNRVLLPEEYTYLIGAIDRMKLRFQKLLQGM